MIRKQFSQKRWALPFVAYLPEEEGQEKLPLIVQLHGGGERGNGKEDLHLVEKFGLAGVVKDKDYKLILAMPQIAELENWAGRQESLFKFIDQLKKQFNIDERRVYLTGLSLGGYGTWLAATTRPHLFAAIAPVCGGGMPCSARAIFMPVWAFHGEDDNIVKVSESDEMVSAITPFNANVKYTRLKGVKHDAWLHAYNEELINWFLSHERESDEQLEKRRYMAINGTLAK